MRGRAKPAAWNMPLRGKQAWNAPRYYGIFDAGYSSIRPAGGDNEIFSDELANPIIFLYILRFAVSERNITQGGAPQGEVRMPYIY